MEMKDPNSSKTLKVAQVALRYALMSEGKAVAGAEVVCRPCCPPRIVSEYGLTTEEILAVIDDVNEIQGSLGWGAEDVGD